MPVTTQEHLQNLVSQGCMTVTELATCHVLADPASPVPVVGGDTLWHARSSTSEDSACLALIPPLAAAILLLQSTSLDSFGDPTYSNLCDPVRGLHGDCFNLWNYFFCVQLWPDSSAEAAMWAFCTSLSDLGKESTRTFAS
jgi:hypothetical protein